MRTGLDWFESRPREKVGSSLEGFPRRKVHDTRENQGSSDSSRRVASRRRERNQGGPERGEPEEGGPERGEPEEGEPEQGGPERGEPERGEPERREPERGGPERGGPEQGEPERGEPERGVPEQGEPERGEPERSVPEQGGPEQGEEHFAARLRPNPDRPTGRRHLRLEEVCGGRLGKTWHPARCPAPQRHRTEV